MTNRSLDLDLLRSFVGVVDSGGFTRAGARLYRSQSTISQQIKRLEDQIGNTLLQREGRNLTLTDAGETLLGYARRILALDDEARATLIRKEVDEIVRVGVSEDFAGRHLSKVLARFGHDNPGVRLDVRADLSANLQRDFESGELDVALLKGEQPSPDAAYEWPEPLRWVGPTKARLATLDPVPLALFPNGCLFRRQALERLDKAKRPWRVAFVSPSLASVQAAVAAGIAIAPLGRSGLTAGLKVLDHQAMKLPALEPIWFSLVARKGSSSRTRLCDTMAEQVDAQR